MSVQSLAEIDLIAVSMAAITAYILGGLWYAVLFSGAWRRAYGFREGEAIYLWLRLPDVTQPRAYVLPWNRNAAQQLQDVGREAERTGTEVIMRGPFAPLDDRQEELFYAPPQPAPPAKQPSGEDTPILPRVRPGG